MRPPCPSPIADFDDRPYLVHVAGVLEAARHREGRSLAQLARWLGYGSHSSVSNQHRAEKWLPVPTLLHEALLLRVPPSSLLPDDPTSPYGKLMQLIAILTPEMQTDLLTFLTAWPGRARFPHEHP